MQRYDCLDAFGNVGQRKENGMRLVLAAFLGLAMMACGDDDDSATTTTEAFGEAEDIRERIDEGPPSANEDECPNIRGATLADLYGAFGREADYVEEDTVGGTTHYWYFGDDDQVVVVFNAGDPVAAGFAIHDGDDFYVGNPPCPLPPPEPGHPAEFTIDQPAG